MRSGVRLSQIMQKQMTPLRGEADLIARQQIMPGSYFVSDVLSVKYIGEPFLLYVCIVSIYRPALLQNISTSQNDYRNSTYSQSCHSRGK